MNNKVLIGLLCLTSSYLQAASLQVEYTGSINSYSAENTIYDVMDGNLSTGDQFRMIWTMLDPASNPNMANPNISSDSGNMTLYVNGVKLIDSDISFYRARNFELQGLNNGPNGDELSGNTFTVSNNVDFVRDNMEKASLNGYIEYHEIVTNMNIIDPSGNSFELGAFDIENLSSGQSLLIDTSNFEVAQLNLKSLLQYREVECYFQYGTEYCGEVQKANGYNITADISSVSVQVVPVPPSIILFLSGMISLFAYKKRHA